MTCRVGFICLSLGSPTASVRSERSQAFRASPRPAWARDDRCSNCAELSELWNCQARNDSRRSCPREHGIARCRCPGEHRPAVARQVQLRRGRRALARRSAAGSRSQVTCLAQSVAAHDFQQAGVIRKAERFGRPGDVPIVFLERAEHDLPFGLRLQRLECSRRSARVSGLVAVPRRESPVARRRRR